MAVSADFLAYVEDLLGGLGALRRKRMFGGVGLYSDEAFFAIAVDDRLYLKTDETTRPRFEEAGSRPFIYENAARGPVETSYWSLPEAALDDPDEAREWGRLALDAARRKAVRRA